MRHDIDWETACNDFHPDFTAVRGERVDTRLLQARLDGRSVIAEVLEPDIITFKSRRGLFHRPDSLKRILETTP
jgi:hypothetical protein